MVFDDLPLTALVDIFKRMPRACETPYVWHQPSPPLAAGVELLAAEEGAPGEGVGAKAAPGGDTAAAAQQHQEGDERHCCPVQMACVLACVCKAWHEASQDASLWTSLVFNSDEKPANGAHECSVKCQIDDEALAALVRRSEGGLRQVSFTEAPFTKVTFDGVLKAVAGFEGKLSLLNLSGARRGRAIFPFFFAVACTAVFDC